MKPQDIDSIVIHCSATPEGREVTLEDIDAMHKAKGWKMVGYNYVIELDGTVRTGRPITIDGAHCNTAGTSGVAYNKHSIGICYVGGVEGYKDSKGRILAKLDSRGKAIPKDTRTDAQKIAMQKLVLELIDKYPIVDILGHRDASPDKNKDGRITRNEWIKDCPCFDVRSEFPIAVCIAKRNRK